MNTVSNQRVITTQKEETNDKKKENFYAKINLQAMEDASKSLTSKAGFKLWCYIAKNQNNYTFALSSQHFCEWSNSGMTAYNSAFKELVDKGYLVLKSKDKSTGTGYIFYEKPHIEEEITQIYYPKEQVDKINNFIF